MPTRVNNHTVVSVGVIPNRIWVRSSRPRGENRRLAQQAVRTARLLVPKLSGRAAKGLTPYWNDGAFGIRWAQSYLWYQEVGIRPFTMTRLAGKVIPMWIDDPTGSEARKNPRSRRRTTRSGRRQILIFRRAALPGQRKRVARRNRAGQILGYRDVPASYPGAPGRISHRHLSATDAGHRPGHIAGSPPRARPHVGVRWRHPGLEGRATLQHAVLSTAHEHGLRNSTCYATYGAR